MRQSLKNNLFSVTRLTVLRMGQSVGKLFFYQLELEKKIFKLKVRKKTHLFNSFSFQLFLCLQGNIQSIN